MEVKKVELLSSFEAFLDEVLLSRAEETYQKELGNNEKDKVLTFNEVCAYFRISPTTLERRIREGLKYSQAVRKGNRLFKLSDCQSFFNLKNN